MPRTRITSTSKDAITDDGNVLISYINGEQLELDFTASWLTSLAGVEIKCKVIEAVNDGSGTRPTQVQSGGVERYLEIRNQDGTAISGRTYETQVGHDGTNFLQISSISGTVVTVTNITQAQATAYFSVGKTFRVNAATGGTLYTVGAYVNNDGYDPDSRNLRFSVTSATGLAANDIFYLEDDHSLTGTGNQFRVVLPDDLITGVSIGSGTGATRHAFTQQPTPGNPVYGFIGMEIAESVSAGQVQQKWRPLRGQVEVLYSVIDA